MIAAVVAVAAAHVFAPLDPISLVETSLWGVLGACVPAMLYLALSGAAALPEADAAGHGVSRIRRRVSAHPDGGVHGVPA
ncbi:MAG TPA: hypothetical protein VF158_01405 [Longimicrobiales bacterium]